jgi:hypothetical protein
MLKMINEAVIDRLKNYPSSNEVKIINKLKVNLKRIKIPENIFQPIKEIKFRIK